MAKRSNKSTPPKDNKRKVANFVVSPKKKSKLDFIAPSTSNLYEKESHLSDIKSTESQFSDAKSPDAVDTLVNLRQTVSTKSMDNDAESVHVQVSSKMKTPIKNIDESVTNLEICDINESPQGSEYSSDEVIIYEYSEKEIVEATCVPIEIKKIIGEGNRITDNLNVVVETLHALNDVSEKSLSGFTKVSNQIVIGYILENYSNYNSIVNLLGYFRQSLITTLDTYYNEKLHQQKETANKKEFSSLKLKLKHSKYNKLKSFDNCFLNLFDLIMIKMDKNYESFKKANYMTVFVKDFNNSYTKFASIINQDDINFITTILKEFVSNKKTN